MGANSKIVRLARKAATEFAALNNITYVIDVKRCHPLITVFYKGQKGSFTISLSPRSGDSGVMDWVKQDMRKTLKTIDDRLAKK